MSVTQVSDELNRFRILEALTAQYADVQQRHSPAEILYYATTYLVNVLNDAKALFFVLVLLLEMMCHPRSHTIERVLGEVEVAVIASVYRSRQ
ncbi:MAG: hypothetical protein AMXMBFR61_17640 [Fimbriimonadales bacterium]